MIVNRVTRVWHDSGLQGTGRRLAAWTLTQIVHRCDRAAQALLSPRSMMTLASRQTASLIAGNRDLADRYRGQRCFILASGPSTLSQDLARLRGEYVIAVNEMFLRTKQEGLKPLVLMIQDLEYFTDTPGYRRFLGDLEAAADESGAEVMVPVAASRIVAKRGLFHHMPPRYYLPVGRVLNYATADDVPPLDFATAVPGMHTVTHTATALALFMGFSEIYLLGVDLDFIANPTAPIRHGYGQNPYNENDHMPAAALFNKKMGWNYPTLLAEVVDHLRCYTRLSEIAKKTGQRIYNANPGGLLETIERRPLASLF